MNMRLHSLIGTDRPPAPQPEIPGAGHVGGRSTHASGALSQNMVKRLVVAFLLLGMVPAYGAEPRFENYPATVRFSGSPAPVDVTSHAKARKFRTVLSAGAGRGPNFAGHYTIVTWGCGTAYQELAIVDAGNGKVYFPDSLRLNAYQMVHDETEPFQFRKDSKLLVISGSPNDREPLGVYFYVWKNNKLKKIHETIRRFEPESGR